MPTISEPDLYDADVIAWSRQQVRLLRAGRFEELDIEHVTSEIEDVAKGEERELGNRMAVLLAHLLKWQALPERRNAGWRNSIAAERRALALRLKYTPSLSETLQDRLWWAETWADAVTMATAETGLGNFPPACPWPLDAILSPDWLPRLVSRPGGFRRTALRP